jgi:radical SAM superfamily enzyme YgiQ (UPF0313 family)
MILKASSGIKVLLLTPPMTQVNTPYPATAYLTGFLRAQGYPVSQADPAITLANKLFSSSGLRAIRDEIREPAESPSVQFFLKNFDAYYRWVDPVLRFLQGRDSSLVRQVQTRRALPEGPRFAQIASMASAMGVATEQEALDWNFGAVGGAELAKFLCSLFVDDLADVIRDGVDNRFVLTRYAESLAASSPSFDPIANALTAPATLIDRLLDQITDELLAKHAPDVIGFSTPFPGSVYGAFRMAKRAKAWRADVKCVWGGGYVNTELRTLSEPRVFDTFDFITLDDGERPFLNLLQYLEGKIPKTRLCRTFVRENGIVAMIHNPAEHDIPFKESGTPTYDGLPLDQYFSLIETVNPMHRLWSDARWNKVTLAHGCYWKKCSFCDTSLDYIGRYDPASADLIIERMSALANETGQRGFHFVDEAAPPATLRQLSTRLVERGLQFSWWGNLRFEKSFNSDLAMLMAKAGCIAVTGGLEVASNRLLKLMNKGVTVEQVARVTKAFNDAGILVHAYLMYGFPSQTLQETVDSLEYVRQLFTEGCLDSAYWHRFSVTVHSPVGKSPADYGVRLLLPAKPPSFAQNDVAFEDVSGEDHDRVGPGLKKALYNYMHGLGLDQDVREWFDFKVPKTTVKKSFIRSSLASS